ncbi:MAG: hypothetical protein WCS07_07750 [Sphaerochaeta sp.]
MRKAWILVCLVILLIGCDAASQQPPSGVHTPTITYIPAVGSTQSDSSHYFRVEGIQESSRSSSSRDVEPEELYELWLMPVARGWDESISHENVRRIKRFPVASNGYSIPKEELPATDPSVVFIMRITEENERELIGFLTLQVDGGLPVIEFPPQNEITGTVSFGSVTYSPDSYLSTSGTTLQENQTSFSTNTYTDLTHLTISQNLVLMAVNTLYNTASDGTFYAPGMLVQYELTDAGTVAWRDLELWVYSNQYDERAALISPSGENLMNDEFVQAQGTNSSVQWFASLPVEEVLSSAQSGALWGLVNEDGEQLAAFDFSVAFVLDEDGYPIIPMIDPTYTLSDTDSNYVESIDFNWFYYGPDGQRNAILPGSDIAGLLRELYIDCPTGTYMLRDSLDTNQGVYRMQGDFFSVNTFNRPLALSDLQALNVGYTYTFYGCNTPMKARLDTE